MKRKTHLPTSLPPSPTETTTASASLCCPTGPLDMYKWSKRLASGTADSCNGCPSWLQLFLYITCKYGDLCSGRQPPPHPRLSLSCSCVLRAVKSQNHVAHSSFKVNNFWLIASTGQASRQLQAPLHSMLHFSNCWNGQQKIHSRARTTKKSPQTASSRTGWGQSPSGIRYTCIQIVVAAAPTWRQTERERELRLGLPTGQSNNKRPSWKFVTWLLTATVRHQATRQRTTGNQQATTDNSNFMGGRKEQDSKGQEKADNAFDFCIFDSFKCG